MAARAVTVLCFVAFLVALVGALSGLVWIATSQTNVISNDFGATLGVVSILCALGAIPIGIISWRWAERRGVRSGLGEAAGIIGGTTLFAWFALLFYALSQDTP